jgi:hypothetical protein
MTAGTGALAGIGELVLGEDALGQPRVTLERPFQAFDLEKVDADTHVATRQ